MGGGKQDPASRAMACPVPCDALTSIVLQIKLCPAPLLKSKLEARDAPSPDTVIQILLPMQHLCHGTQQETHTCHQLH